jgi:hypothetical protein
MAHMWSGTVVVHFVGAVDGVFCWSFISSCANCYDKQLEYIIAAGSRNASWPVFSQSVIPRCVEVPWAAAQGFSG